MIIDPTLHQGEKPHHSPAALDQATGRTIIDLDALPASYLLDDQQAAEVLGVSPGTLSVWRSTGRYNLCHTKIGRRVRYRAGDLREFIARRTKTHTGS